MSQQEYFTLAVKTCLQFTSLSIGFLPLEISTRFPGQSFAFHWIAAADPSGLRFSVICIGRSSLINLPKTGMDVFHYTLVQWVLYFPPSITLIDLFCLSYYSVISRWSKILKAKGYVFKWWFKQSHSIEHSLYPRKHIFYLLLFTTNLQS